MEVAGSIPVTGAIFYRQMKLTSEALFTIFFITTAIFCISAIIGIPVYFAVTSHNANPEPYSYIWDSDTTQENSQLAHDLGYTYLTVKCSNYAYHPGPGKPIEIHWQTIITAYPIAWTATRWSHASRWRHSRGQYWNGIHIWNTFCKE